MTIPAASTLLRFEQVAFDGSEGAPGLDWQIENEKPNQISYDRQLGSLTIKTRGSFTGQQNDYQSLLLIKNPVPGENFRITLLLGPFVPQYPGRQAALLCWNDSDNYLKLSYQRNPNFQTPSATLLSEAAGRISAGDTAPLSDGSSHRWLRLTRSGDLYAYASSTDGIKFDHHGWRSWAGGEPQFFGLAGLSFGSPPKKK